MSELVTLDRGRTEDIVDDTFERIEREQAADPGATHVVIHRDDVAELERQAPFTAPERDDEPAFEIAVSKPRAIDLRKLWSQLDVAMPPELAADFGNRVPVLLCHGITPFYAAGTPPSGVWGIGYEARIVRTPQADTVSLTPTSRAIDRAAVGLDVCAGVKLGGEIDVPEELLPLGRELTGLSLHEARLFTTIDAPFALALSYRLSALEVQAGPVGAGGARWNLYGRGKRLDLHQPLFHTVLVPADTPSLVIEVEGWVKRRRGLADVVGGRSVRLWTYGPRAFTVALGES
jgi:hypothetical protein